MNTKLNLKSIEQKKNINETSVDKTSILEISSAIENSISMLKSSPAHTSGQSSVAVMQLTDKIQLLRQSCKQYSDDCPPQQRFRFRELLTKIDTHCDQLKTTNSLHSNKLYSDIHNTLRDITNLVQRWSQSRKSATNQWQQWKHLTLDYCSHCLDPKCCLSAKQSVDRFLQWISISFISSTDKFCSSKPTIELDSISNNYLFLASFLSVKSNWQKPKVLTNFKTISSFSNF